MLLADVITRLAELETETEFDIDRRALIIRAVVAEFEMLLLIDLADDITRLNAAVFPIEIVIARARAASRLALDVIPIEETTDLATLVSLENVVV
jgi:hypothetical protein